MIKRRILDWLSGAMVLSGLWMFDEVLTLSRYCGKDCLYPIPFLGSFTQYGAEGIAWILIVVGELLLFEKGNSHQREEVQSAQDKICLSGYWSRETSSLDYT